MLDHHPQPDRGRGDRQTVVVSLGTSFGLSILLWQHILGIELHFMVMVMTVIVLLAVGATG